MSEASGRWVRRHMSQRGKPRRGAEERGDQRRSVVACGRSVLTYYKYAPLLARLAPSPDEFSLRAMCTCGERGDQRRSVVACGRSVLTYYKYAPLLACSAPGTDEFSIHAMSTCTGIVAPGGPGQCQGVIKYHKK